MEASTYLFPWLVCPEVPFYACPCDSVTASGVEVKVTVIGPQQPRSPPSSKDPAEEVGQKQLSYTLALSIISPWASSQGCLTFFCRHPREGAYSYPLSLWLGTLEALSED